MRCRHRKQSGSKLPHSKGLVGGDAELGNGSAIGGVGTVRQNSGGCPYEKKRRRGRRLTGFVFFALLVDAARELFELGLLLGSEEGADAVAALVADLVSLRILGSVEGAHLSAGFVDDLANLLDLIRGELELASKLRHHLIAAVGNRSDAPHALAPEVVAHAAEQHAENKDYNYEQCGFALSLGVFHGSIPPPSSSAPGPGSPA